VFGWLKRIFRLSPRNSVREIADEAYIVETFAHRNPSDRNFSLDDRKLALCRAADAAGIPGLVSGFDQIDLLYYHYRIEIELLTRSQPQSHSSRGVH
jgi:hypothetical protein